MHLNDVLCLSQLLALATRIPLAAKIGDDLHRFLDRVAGDDSIGPNALQLGEVTVPEFAVCIAQAYGQDQQGGAAPFDRSQ